MRISFIQLIFEWHSAGCQNTEIAMVPCLNGACGVSLADRKKIIIKCNQCHNRREIFNSRVWRRRLILHGSEVSIKKFKMAIT